MTCMYCQVIKYYGFGWIKSDVQICIILCYISLCFLSVPTGSPSRGGDVAVYVFDINQPSLPTPFFIILLFCSCVYFCSYLPFNCISFHKVSWQLSAFSLWSSGLISALFKLLVLSIIYLYKSLPQPWYNLVWFNGLKAPNNQLTNSFCFIPFFFLLFFCLSV